MSLADAATVQRVAADVVRRWRHAWLRPMQPVAGAHFDGDLDTATGHFALFDGGTVLCIASVFRQPDARLDDAPADAQWRLRGMATRPAHFSRGLGGQVLAAALDWTRNHGAEVVWCNARTPAVAFYRRHGFVTRGTEFELPDIGPHFLMTHRR